MYGSHVKSAYLSLKLRSTKNAGFFTYLALSFDPAIYKGFFKTEPVDVGGT